MECIRSNSAEVNGAAVMKFKGEPGRMVDWVLTDFTSRTSNVIQPESRACSNATTKIHYKGKDLSILENFQCSYIVSFIA